MAPKPRKKAFSKITGNLLFFAREVYRVNIDDFRADDQVRTYAITPSALGNALPVWAKPTTSGIERQVHLPGEDAVIHTLYTDYDYAATMSLKMARGRFFPGISAATPKKPMW